MNRLTSILCHFHLMTVFTGRNEVVAKAMFLQVCVCPQGGGCLPQCMLGCQTPQTRQTPPQPGRHPPDQADTPHTRQTPPDQADTHTPRPGRHPPRTKQTPPDQADTPPRQTPPPGPSRPPREADSSIRSTSGRYASYWNAFLFLKILTQ